MRGYDEDDEVYDEPPSDRDIAAEECGRWRNGRLTRNCTKAGSEDCDFLCPYRGHQYILTQSRSATYSPF